MEEAAKQLPIVEHFISGESKVFVAGSSWQPDEEIFIPWFKKHPDWKLIIAPHVIDEAHLQQIEKVLEGFRVERYTRLVAQGDTNPSSSNVLLIDCFGLLSSIYHYGDVAYVGGGFGVGIHNLLEAAVWDMPVIFGPNNQRFQEAQGLKACEGGFEIKDAADFDAVMQRFLSNPSAIAELGKKAGLYVERMTGATAKILSDVQL